MTKGVKYGIKNQLEKVFNRVAYSKETGFIGKILFSPLFLLSTLYRAAIKIRFALYSSGLFKAKKVDCKVISVGNITVGGTGKTPTVEFIARSLHERGLKVAVLSRGYKRAGRGIGIVSDGQQLLLGPKEAGDEPYMLARRLRTIPVLVGADRHELGIYALERFPLDAIILDDGFQHIRLKRDLDILLVDGEKGFGNGHLLPRGPLREPLSGMKRADIFLITKSSSVDDGVLKLIKRNSEAAVFKSGYRPKRLVSVWDGVNKGTEALLGARVMAFSAIANPSSFLSLLLSMGCAVVSDVSFPDHFDYDYHHLRGVWDEAKRAGADFIITTEKDAAKLERFKENMSAPVYYLERDLDMQGDEKRFIDSVLSGISS